MNTNNPISYNEGDAVLKAIVATVVVALVAGGVAYFIVKKKMGNVPVYYITESQKLAVLEKLAKDSPPQPSAVERSQILEVLVTGSQSDK